MLTQISINIIILFIIVYFFRGIVFHEYGMSRRSLWIGCIVFAFSVGIFAASLEPDIYQDLYRYHSFEKYMMQAHTPFIWLYDSVNLLIVWKLLLGASILMGDVHSISLICITITVALWYLILLEWKKKFSITHIDFLLYMLISFALISMENLFMGVRNVLAYTIFCYGLVRVFNSRKSIDWIIFGVCVVLSMLLHTAVVILFACFLVCLVYKKNAMYLIILTLWSVLVDFITFLFRVSSIEYLMKIAVSIYNYTKVETTNIRFEVFISRLGISIIMLIILCYVQFKKNEIVNTIYFKYMMCLVAFAIGAYKFPHVVYRMNIGIGLMIFPIIKILRKEKDIYSFLFMLAMIIFSLGMYAYGYVAIEDHNQLIMWNSLFTK